MRKTLLGNNHSYKESGTVAHFGVNVAQNGSQYPNWLNRISSSKSTTQKSLKSKILSENVFYRLKGTVTHFRVKVAHPECKSDSNP